MRGCGCRVAVNKYSVSIRHLDESESQGVHSHHRTADTSRIAVVVVYSLDAECIWRMRKVGSSLRVQRQQVWDGRASRGREGMLHRTRPSCYRSKNRLSTYRRVGDRYDAEALSGSDYFEESESKMESTDVRRVSVVRLSRNRQAASNTSSK